MLKTKNIAIIGAGRLGQALSLFYNNHSKYGNLYLIDKEPGKDIILNRHVQKTTVSYEAIENSHVIHLCVKPKDFYDVTNDLNVHITNHHTVFSWIPTITEYELQKSLHINKEYIFRAMTNVLCQYNKSDIYLYSSIVKNHYDRYNTEYNFNNAKCIWLTKESQMLPVTLANGSGPAFIADFLQQINEIAEQNNIPKNIAYQIMKNNIAGIHYWLQDGKNLQDLKIQVASPSGLTEQGLKIMRNTNLTKILRKLFTPTS